MSSITIYNKLLSFSSQYGCTTLRYWKFGKIPSSQNMFSVDENSRYGQYLLPLNSATSSYNLYHRKIHLLRQIKQSQAISSIMVVFRKKWISMNIWSSMTPYDVSISIHGDLHVYIGLGLSPPSSFSALREVI